MKKFITLTAIFVSFFLLNSINTNAKASLQFKERSNEDENIKIFSNRIIENFFFYMVNE